MSSAKETIPVTLRLKYKTVTVYVNADPTETISQLKERLASSLNETKALDRKVSSGTSVEMDEDIDIPLPSFATTSSSSSSSTAALSKDKGKGVSRKASSKDSESTSSTEIEPENIKIGVPISEDLSSGFKEVKSTTNGKQQKLEAAGIKTNMSLAFTPSLDEDFKIDIMSDAYYDDDE